MSQKASKADLSILEDYKLRSLMDGDIPKTAFMKAFSLAYLGAMQNKARGLAMEGKITDAKLITDRMREIRKEAALLLQ